MHIASTTTQATNLILVRCIIEHIRIVNTLMKVDPSTIPEQVISTLAVLFGVWHEEYIIHVMPDHMRPGNLFLVFYHHRGISPLFNYYIKAGA